MKITQIILSCILVVTISACNQKVDPVEKPAAESKGIMQKTQETAPPATHEVAKTVTVTTKPVEEGTKKTAVTGKAANAATEQALSETIDHAQAVTKTQKSEARQRGKKAEDEMMMEVEKGK